MNFGSWKEPLIVFLAVPFSLIGSFWLLYLLDYNLSIAVWVGIIALAGLDAETGVVMLLYLLLAYRQWEGEGRMRNLDDLKESIHHGAVKRVRPKVMTVTCLIAGLAPIMWASTYETGADVMKRMAAPMVGGLVTSFILELTIYPAIFLLWKGVGMGGWRTLVPGMAPRRTEGAPEAEFGRRRLLRVLGLLLSLLLAGLLAWAVWIWLHRPAALPPMQPVATQQAGGTEVGIFAPDGRFRSGLNRFRITFRTTNGEPVEPADARVQFYMPAMGTMPAMQAPADLQRTAPGEMTGQVELPMGGEWQLRLSFETPAGSQNVRVGINAQ